MLDGKVVMQKDVVRILEQLKERIVANMRAADAVATGKTIRSLHVVEENDGAALVSDSEMPFGVLETGRRSGKVPAGFQRIIYEWMMAKGVHGEPIPYKTNREHRYTPQERGDRSLAFLIARKIRRDGTSLFRRGGRTDIYTQEIPKAVEEAERTITAIVGAYVEDMIKLTSIGVEEQ